MYAALEYDGFAGSTSNFPFAKALGIYVIPITVTVLYYLYTAVLGYGVLPVDIAIFFVMAVVVERLVRYRLLTASPLPEQVNRFALVALAVLVILSVVFTFHAPQCPPFRDPVTGGYGIFG